MRREKGGGAGVDSEIVVAALQSCQIGTAITNMGRSLSFRHIGLFMRRKA